MRESTSSAAMEEQHAGIEHHAVFHRKYLDRALDAIMNRIAFDLVARLVPPGTPTPIKTPDVPSPSKRREGWRSLSPPRQEIATDNT